MYWKVSIFLNVSQRQGSILHLNLVLLYIIVSENTVSVSNVSVVNLIVG